jgi:hypothetical protein
MNPDLILQWVAFVAAWIALVCAFHTYLGARATRKELEAALERWEKELNLRMRNER